MRGIRQISRDPQGKSPIDLARSFAQIAEVEQRLKSLEQEFKEKLARAHEHTQKERGNLIEGFKSAAGKYLREEAEGLIQVYDSELKKLVQNLHSHAQNAAEAVQKIQKGEKGDTGYTPQFGKDYFTPQHKKEIVQEVHKLIVPPKDGKDGESVDPEKVIELLIERLTKDKRLKVEHIDGLSTEIASYRNQLAGKHYGRDTWARGGGDTVAAGTGISISKDANGKTVITNTSAGAGTQVYDEVPTGSGTAFSLAHTPLAGTVRIYRGGSRISVSNGDYTIIGANITLLTSLAVGETLTADYTY